MKRVKRLIAVGALSASIFGFGALTHPASADWACVGIDAANLGVCVDNPFPDGPPPIPLDRPGPHPLLPPP